VTNRSFTAELGRALHRPAFLAVPSWALRVALGAGLASEVVLASQRVQPERLLARGFRFRHPTLDVALANLVGAAS